MVVRHGDVVSPSLHTKDNHSKELKYNQTQPNSTEPMKMFPSGSENGRAGRGTELRPAVGQAVSGRVPADALCADDL